MAKDFSKMASEIMKYIGGPDNVIDVAHCATRLRFRLKNTDMVDSLQLERTEGVIKTLESGGQFQIVIGNKVSLVYEEILKSHKNLATGQENTGSEENKNIFDTTLDSVFFSSLLENLIMTILFSFIPIFHYATDLSN